MSTKIEQEQIWNYVETWIQVEKPISNTENRHPMQSLAPLQKEGNISYHSICPRKSTARKHIYSYIQHRATVNEIFHNLISEIAGPFSVFFVIDSAILFADGATT